MRWSLIVGLFVVTAISDIPGQLLTDSTDKRYLQLQTVGGAVCCITASPKTALIVSQGISCSECHTVLERAIEILDSTCVVYVGCPTKSRRSIDRRESVQRVQKLVKTKHVYLFREAAQDSACALFVKIDQGERSPALVLFTFGVHQHSIPYEVMFVSDDTSLPSPETVASRIQHLLRLAIHSAEE